MAAEGDECILCKPEGKIENMLKGYEYDENSKNPWVFVPREPEAFGHLVVVAGKHYTDISDEKLTKDAKHLGQIMSLINELCVGMRRHLKFEGRTCEKVYVSTLCETEKMHLHFHLIPRFEGDKEGFMHLFERELEGARWIYDCKREECKADCKHTFEKECRKKYDKINDSSGRLLIAECVVKRHKSWICSDRWAKSNEERESFIKEIKEKIEEII